MNKTILRSTLLLVITIILIAVITAVSPAERTLGTNVRVVYLHGAWVWTALITLLVSGVIGLMGLVLKKTDFYLYSRASARSGVIFWITYLPLSLWAMQSNWNGLFLAEPRWRVAISFAIAGFLLQVGLTLVQRPRWDAILNVVFIAALFMILQFTANVMHPPAPIQESGVARIQIFFYLLVGISMMASLLLTRILFKVDHPLTLKE